MQLQGNYIDPTSFNPSNQDEYVVWDTWRRLEPNNMRAFTTTYLKAYKDGLPIYKFGEFASEIEQDPSIKKRGAIFNKKVREFLAKSKII